MNHDIFLRAHTVAPEKRPPKPVTGRKWPTRVLVFDTETTIDTRQDLTFGVYRLCELIDGVYRCSEEGFLHADELDGRQHKVIEAYVKHEFADIDVKSFPPKLKLKLWRRAEFIEKVFWKAVKDTRLIVGFNLPFDLSRLAVGWAKADNGGWSLILSQRRSRKTGKVEPNPERPRVRLKYPFIALSGTQHPREWPQARFLDLHTLAFALFGELHTLRSLCKSLKIEGKLEHEPTGVVSVAEIKYCRQDVRATLNALNALKQECDQHPLELHPDRAYSPASLAKAYLDAMGIVSPKEKFRVSDHVLGIAMQAYYGGRAECRIRRSPVPVVHTDFKSQYPTINALLGNWSVLTAKRVSFDDATRRVRRFLQTVTLPKVFEPNFWKRLSFFALIRPEKDILPVRAVYNRATPNIGVNEFSSDRPIWFAGPDIVASILLTGKIPRVQKAVRMIPHGKQARLRATNLRGMIAIHPKRHDFFRYVVEQRELHKSNEPLAGFLKVLANAGSYGLFVELNPEQLPNPVTIRVFSGEATFEPPDKDQIVERQGQWYFPPLAALITAGGRLLLAMLERCVRGAGGAYLFSDTDSLCIVASRRGGRVRCDNRNGKEIKALSWKQADRIAERFAALNPYDARIISTILKLEDVNYDSTNRRQRLTGYAVSAKRYVLYRQQGKKLSIIEPKAHGLGYLYPPKDKKSDAEPDWVFEAWDWMLREALGLPRKIPTWLNVPAMMRIVLSTPFVLARLNRSTRPYNFLLCPLIDSVAGYPANVDPDRFTLITEFTSERRQWLRSKCINVHDGKVYRLALEQSPKLDRVIPQTFDYVLRRYASHLESKSLAPDGGPCTATTRGLLQRASIVAGRLRYVGKEADRRWEQGEDLSLLSFAPLEYSPQGTMDIADAELREAITRRGMRELMRKTGLSQHTIEAIRAGQPVRRRTLKRMEDVLTNATS